MAKTISDEKMKLSIVIDGNEAQKALFDLEKRTRSLNEENKALLLQKKLLEQQGKKDTDAYKALTLTIKANTAEITANKIKMKELQDQLGLTGLTMKQLSDKALALKLALRNTIPGSEAHQRYTNELRQVQARIDEVSGKAKTAKFSIGSMADSFNRFQGIALSVIAVLTGVVFSIQKIIDYNGKLSDSMADVQKTTGMTREEVENLAKSFGLFKTRTSRIDLLGIAEIGGKIGIAKNDILDFVTVMNKAGVALGEDFEGGAEGVADKLGKIKNLYKELRDAGVEITFEAVGSALNDLGAAGTASESNVADFVTRVGSMPDVFKPSIATALGLGAAFEESGIMAEKAGTNYSKVITLAANNVAGFAKQMGKPKKVIEDLINSDPNEFFLQFAESLKGLSGTELANVLDKLKLNDNEVKQVLGAASANTDLFREKIELANQSMNTATSLTNEYDIKNNNLAATLEKISKTVSGWFSSESFIKWLTTAVDWISRFVGATDDADGSVTAWRNTLVFTAKIIAVVTAAIMTNVGWQELCALWTNRNTEATLLYNIASKARAFWDGLVTLSTQALVLAHNLLTLNVLGATQAFRAMTATMMSTPWGFILGAVAAISTAYVLFSDSAKEAATAQSMMNENMKDADAIVKKESASFLALIEIIKDKTASHEAQTAALKKAKEIGGEYTKGLTLENAATFEGKKMIDAYITSLEKKAMLQVLEKRQASIMEDIQKRKNMSLEEEISWYDKAVSGIKGLINPSMASADLIINASKKRSDALSDLQKQLNFTNAEMKAFLKANPNMIKDLGGDTGTSTGGDTSDETKKPKKDPNSTLAEINRLKLEENQKFNDAYLKQQRQLEVDRIAAMEDGYAKERAIENQRYQREIDDLNKQKVHDAELAKLDEDISKAQKDKDITKYNALLEIKKGWADKNLKIDEQINQVIEGKLAVHNLKLATIEERAATEAIKKLGEKYEQEKIVRETAFLQELNSRKLSDVEKKKRQDKFNEQELIYQEAHLKEVLALFDDIINKQGGATFDLSLLTDTQVKEFTEKAAALGLTLQELINKKNELSGAKKGEDQANAMLNSLAGSSGDIFGFSAEQWQQTFDSLDTTTEKLAAIGVTVNALGDLWGKYNEFVTANENRQIAQFEKNSETRKRRLKQQLDSGVITQEKYSKQSAKIDEETDKKKAEIEYEQAKRQKKMAVVDVIIKTAMAIMQAFSQLGPIGGAIAAVLIGGMGALQIATINRQPLPAKGYEEGLYSDSLVKREQDGKVFKSRYAGKTKSGLVTRTSHFMVAENGPEMVIDNKAWQKMNPDLKNSLIRELQGIKGFENGYYKNETLYTGNSSSGKDSSENVNNLIIAMLSQNLEVLTDLRDNPLMAIMSNKDLNSMKNIKEGLAKYEAIRNDNKVR
ncbi:phage tail tape measure protein [Flavobacterium denitrificans]|uniref:phage tail tape measure protein n=1 Tax=Flavobacterium denitrificans TaxID=281361 RepID=UPI00041E4FFA|nr:phage tail tape measure protein [Flavobacterium denitrificans]